MGAQSGQLMELIRPSWWRVLLAGFVGAATGVIFSLLWAGCDLFGGFSFLMVPFLAGVSVGLTMGFKRTPTAWQIFVATACSCGLLWLAVRAVVSSASPHTYWTDCFGCGGGGDTAYGFVIFWQPDVVIFLPLMPLGAYAAKQGLRLIRLRKFPNVSYESLGNK